MKKVKVTILKLAGETGLRLPGQSMLLTEDVAANYAERGLVKLGTKRKKIKK